MSDEIRQEQEKLAQRLSKLSVKEKEKQVYGMMCWLQGHEAGFQAGLSAREDSHENADC